MLVNSLIVFCLFHVLVKDSIASVESNIYVVDSELYTLAGPPSPTALLASTTRVLFRDATRIDAL